MAFDNVPEFSKELRKMPGIAPVALEFAILTAARSGEVMGAQWNEVDLTARVWTVPATPMKGGREHRVPLSGRAVLILKAMQARKASQFVFPGSKQNRPLSVMALEMVLRRAKIDATVHGFRSAFRDWSGERTTFPREVAEAALAHLVVDQTERAYRRGDALEKRRADGRLVEFLRGDERQDRSPSSPNWAAFVIPLYLTQGLLRTQAAGQTP